MKVLGIDCGIKKVGWAVFSYNSLIDCGFISTQKTAADKMNIDIDLRIKLIREELKQKVLEHRPDCIVYEFVPLFGDYISARRGGIYAFATRMMVTCLGFELGIPTVGVNEKIWKKLLLDSFKASKKEVKERVINQFGHCTSLKLDGGCDHWEQDVYDAIAITYWGYNRLQTSMNPKGTEGLKCRRKRI